MVGAKVVELYYSKPLALTVFVLVTASVLSSGLSMFALSLQKGLWVFGLLGLAVLAPIYFLLYRFVFRALRSGSAVVILDADGITDVRQTVSFVAWDDVQRVRLGSGNGAHYLCIDFKSTKIAGHAGSPSAWRLFSRLAHSLGDWNVYLLSLACSRTEVQKRAEELRRAAIRRRVVSLNQKA